MSYKEQILAAERLSQKITVPALPASIIELQKLFEKTELPEPAQVKRLVSANPYVAGELVGLANMPNLSSNNRLQTKVKDVDAAIFRLGNRYIKNYVMAIVVKQFMETQKVAGLSYHSQAIAILCSLIAKHNKRIRSDEAYLLGLLHDVGAFALAELDDMYGQVFISSLNKYYTLEEREIQKFGTTHAAMGYVLSQGWSMPNYISQTILLHHSSQFSDIKNEKLKSLVAMVELAHALQIKSFDAVHETRDNSKVYEESVRTLDLSQEDINQILTEASKQIKLD